MVGRNGWIIRCLSIEFSPAVLANYNSTKVCFAYFRHSPGSKPDKEKTCVRHLSFLRSSPCLLDHLVHARTGTLAVRSSLPQLTQAPLIARRIAFQMQ